MQWEQVLTIIIANLGVTLVLFLWLRSEANADRRQIQNDISCDRKEILTMINSIRDEIHEIQKQTKELIRSNDAINFRLNQNNLK